MRITNEIIKKTVVESVGFKASDIVEYLKKRKNVSEFKISEKIELNINQTRNILYKLYEKGFMKYYRKKDSKGWYVCYWTFNKKNIRNIHDRIKAEKIEMINNLIDKEEDQNYFSCENLCVKVDFDTAYKNHFKCPECGSLMEEIDNHKRIEHLKKRILEIKSSA